MFFFSMLFDFVLRVIFSCYGWDLILIIVCLIWNVVTGLDLLICVNVFNKHMFILTGWVKSYYSWDLILYNCVFNLECCESCDRLRFCDLCSYGWNLIKKDSVKEKSK